MNAEKLKSIYDGVVKFNNASPAEKELLVQEENARNELAQAANTNRDNQLKSWGEKLAASSVGELIESLDGLEGYAPKIGAQPSDSFRKVLSGNTLSLEYVNPGNTSWTGKLIEVDLTLSEGKENWNVHLLTQITHQTYTFQEGGMEFFRRVPQHESIEFSDEQSVYEYLEKYVETHSSAATLRGAIGKYFEGSKLLVAPKVEPAPQA